MIIGKTKKIIDYKFNELVINLENNYKDLAKDALKDLYLTNDELLLKGQISDKDHNKIKLKIDSYNDKMKGYGH